MADKDAPKKRGRGRPRKEHKPDPVEAMLNEAKAPNKGGRPFALTPDETTIERVVSLGAMQATTIECAFHFRVCEKTWIEFKKRWPEVQEAYDFGSSKGKLNTRRQLMRLADKHPQAAIFLAKNWLGMTDKLETKVTGEIAMNVDADDMKM